VTAEEEQLIARVSQYVKEKLASEGTGHDWWHIERVRQTARLITTEEHANALVVELAALTHDLGDPKLYHGDYSAVPRVAKRALLDCGASAAIAERVAIVVNEVSFKGPAAATTPTSLEAAIVQDADRLDAIGAIGIARAFTFGGSCGRPLYDPAQPPNPTMTTEEYSKKLGTTINHFYEKVLLIKSRLNTITAKQIAEHRHKFVEKFLKEFLEEWNGTL